MRSRGCFALAAFLGCALLANQARATEVLTFEGPLDNEQIADFYNGGTGGYGSGPGPNYGISFGSDSLALISTADGGSGNFSNNPSGDTIAYFVSGQGDVMNVAGGFTTGFSLYYAAANIDGSVTVYSGLDGTGSVLANLTLPVTSDPYTNWVPAGITFSGTAMSAIFSGSANYIGFDDITLGSSTPGATVPLPSAFYNGMALITLIAGAKLYSRRISAA